MDISFDPHLETKKIAIKLGKGLMADQRRLEVFLHLENSPKFNFKLILGFNHHKRRLLYVEVC